MCFVFHSNVCVCVSIRFISVVVALVLAADSEGIKGEEITADELEKIRRRQAGKPVTSKL